MKTGLEPIVQTVVQSGPAIRQVQACVAVGYAGGQHRLQAARGGNPLRFLCPQAKSDQAVWVYSTNYGGGFVSGDQLHIDVTVAADAHLVLTNQASTKIYKNSAEYVCGQYTRAAVADGGLLCVVGHPLCCFADAYFIQTQQFALSRQADLVYADCISAGRIARGEVWDFAKFTSTTSIEVMGQPVLHEPLVLCNNPGEPTVAERMGGFQAYGMLCALGPGLQDMCAAWRECIRQLGPGEHHGIAIGLSEIPGGALIRCALRQVEYWYTFLDTYLHYLQPRIGGRTWEQFKG